MLSEMIKKRKSTRSFTGVPVEEEKLEKIRAFIRGAKPLYEGLSVYTEIVGRDAVKCICPWTTPQLLAIYSSAGEGAWENAGFILEQVDLYLHSIGLGSCYLGMGRMKDALPPKEGMKFLMLLAFGYPKGELYRKSKKEFKRKSLSEISDILDERLEAARLAPSGVNSQPWYFTHEGEKIHAFCKKDGLFKHQFLSDMNRMDMGIALAHLYLSYPAFRFFKEDVKELKGYGYIGSITI